MTPSELSTFLETHKGGVTIEEGLALCRYAEACCNGLVVEIGSFKGKSSVALAAGQARGKFAAEGLIYCIEPHLPFVGIYGGVFGAVDRRDFYAVMLKTGFFDRVALVNLPSSAAAAGWTRPIGLLFVDGDHSLQGVRTDIEAWEPHVAPGGTIIFDDATDPLAGAYPAIKELLEGGRFELSETVGKMVALRKLAQGPKLARRAGKKILVACHEMVVAGGLLRFERFGRAIARYGHSVSFLAFGDASLRSWDTAHPVLTYDEAARRTWDSTFVPGAGFPEPTVAQFERLREPSFGVRVQHILNDMTKRASFLRVNRSFAPDTVVFNNTHWPVGEFTEFQASAFHFLVGAVDVETLAPDPLRAFEASGRPFTVGGLANKNDAALIEAVRLCGEGVRLHLFGAESAVARGATDLIAGGRLRLSGVLDESALGRFYAGVDCVAHVETFAGWANLAAEAMASGVPLVATPHGTLAFAEHEKTALVVPEPSPEALAKAILRLRDDPNLARQLAHAGRERIRSFSWNAYSADLLELAERPAFQYYAWSPDMGLFGKWPEAQRLDGLDPLLESCAGKSVLDLGAGEGVVSRRLLDRGAAAAHGFEYELSRVALANRIFDGFAGARFWQADLSNWGDFLARNASRLRASYDIVLYLGLHHHLPAATRMDTLAGAAKLSSDWFALRTPDALFRADNIEAAMVELGFSSVRQTGNSGLALGGSHIFRRRVPARSEREDLAHE